MVDREAIDRDIAGYGPRRWIETFTYQSINFSITFCATMSIIHPKSMKLFFDITPKVC